MSEQDDQIIRRQQNRDARESVPEDERTAPKGRGDLDPQSGQAREAAKAGETQNANEQMDAIFESNRGTGGGGRIEDELFRDAATDGAGGLAQKGRSLLGS